MESKNGTNEPIYKIEIESQMYKSILQSPRGKGGGVNWEIGIDIYTLLYIQQITNKDLLFSTGNSTQYSVMAYVGKNLKADICIHLTESLCCTYQTNTTLQINYTLIKINLKKLKIQCNPHNEANWKPLSI